MSINDHEELTREAVFDLMNSPRRRFVMYYLNRIDEPVELQSLADQVAAWENDLPIEELDDQQKKRVYVSLYQTHVPKLAESGVITFDRDSGILQITDRADDVARYLATEQPPIPWEQYYLGLAVVGAIVFGLGAIGVWIFGPLSPELVGLILSVVLLVLAGFHFSTTRRDRRSALETLVEDR